MAAKGASTSQSIWASGCADRMSDTTGSVCTTSPMDVVFTSNFFEHLETKQDLRNTLLEARRCLRPGGRLIAMGPNIRYTGGAYWDFFDHYLPLTELSLAEVLREVGFEVEEQVARFLPYSMSQGAQKPVWTLRLYLRLPFLWPLFGKQFLLVAKK